MAAGALLPNLRLVDADQSDRRSNNRPQAGAALAAMGDELAAHAWIPEARDVSGDVVCRFGFVGVGVKKRADVVRH